MAHDVFITNAVEDEETALAACTRLESDGMRCWIASRDAAAADGGDAAIARAKIVLVVFSRHANASDRVQRGVARAARIDVPLLNLRLEDVPPAREFKLYLEETHWLDATTPPLSARLDDLADACAGLLSGSDGRAPTPTTFATRRRRYRTSARVALIAGCVVCVGAVAVLAGYVLRPSVPDAGSQAVTTSQTVSPSERSAAQARIVDSTGSWSVDGFHDAIVDRRTDLVALYLTSGMEATTLHDGASAILYGFQGIPQNGDPLALLETFVHAGFDVDDALHDTTLMPALTDDWFPAPFKTDLAPEGYSGGYAKNFVGTLLFWIVQRYLWVGNDQDLDVVRDLIRRGADCTVPLSFLDSTNNSAPGSSPYDELKACSA